ncbi:MAG: thiamine diphosphokinase [bacterium]|nr:thiamine diphosphokinase [bacterium]MCM1375602.1 thiamine diphosphokinase [Muribaculum sp.]
MKTQTGKCIIVAAGEMTLSEIPVSPDDLLIAVDGGFAHCQRLGLTPDLVLGDFDSAGEEQLAHIVRWEEQCPERVIRLKPEKNDTDTLASLRVGLERGYTSFLIYGAIRGQRLEHTLANIQCLLFLRRNGAVGYLIDADCSCFVLEDEERSFGASQVGYLSLFSLGGQAVGVDIQGMKYELDNARITNDFPIGISNEFIGRNALIRVRSGALLVIVTRSEGPGSRISVTE